MSLKIKHYDFIEIGTSDFDTLIETSNDNTVGISIEPIKYYINRLPDKQNIIKVQAALSTTDGEVDVYYIEDSKIEENNLPWWVRGSNSINNPHPFAIKELGEELYNSLVTIEKVPTISWKTLIDTYGVESIGYLKIDTEGHDHIIFRDFLNYCKEHSFPIPNKITLEYHDGVSNKVEIDKLISELPEYQIIKHISDITLMKPLIPRVIHQTYKTNDLPTEISEVVQRLKDMNPTFEYRFYNDEDCLNFIKENYDEETLNLYLSINPNYGSAKSDFFRYLLMYKVGGVYLDIKSCTTIPLEETLLPTDEYLLTHWEGLDWADELKYQFGEFQKEAIAAREKADTALNDVTKNREVDKERVRKSIADIGNSILSGVSPRTQAENQARAELRSRQAGEARARAVSIAREAGLNEQDAYITGENPESLYKVGADISDADLLTQDEAEVYNRAQELLTLGERRVAGRGAGVRDSFDKQALLDMIGRGKAMSERLALANPPKQVTQANASTPSEVAAVRQVNPLFDASRSNNGIGRGVLQSGGNAAGNFQYSAPVPVQPNLGENKDAQLFGALAAAFKDPKYQNAQAKSAYARTDPANPKSISTGLAMDFTFPGAVKKLVDSGMTPDKVHDLYAKNGMLTGPIDYAANLKKYADWYVKNVPGGSYTRDPKYKPGRNS